LGYTGEILPLIFSFAVIGVILYLCYMFTKTLSQKTSGARSTRNIKIIERAALSQDKGLAIAEVCGKYYLVGFSGGSIEILETLDPDDLVLARPELAQDFLSVFQSALKNRPDFKKIMGKMKKNGRENNEK